MPFLRQSTSQVILFGPCLDISDGVTEEISLTLAQADMRLSKDGGAFGPKNAAGNAAHDTDGWYNTTLDATDTATVGILVLNVHQPANMLPVWVTFYVVEEAVYDAMYGASALGPKKAKPINTALSNIPVFMALASDHVTEATGLTLTVTRSLDAAAFESATGTAAEIGNGMYQYDASAADMNAAFIILRFAEATADSTVLVFETG